jgi:hypothetical protein
MIVPTSAGRSRVMRGRVLLRAALAACALAAIPEAVSAQRPPGQPAPFPVDRQIERYTRQPALPDPIRDRERAEQERLKRLGLPVHEPPKAGPGKSSEPLAPAVPAFDRHHQRFDVNRDGSLSRQEYVNSRMRAMPPQYKNTWREREYRDRVNAQYRAINRNRDRRITPDELQNPPSGRF